MKELNTSEIIKNRILDAVEKKLCNITFTPEVEDVKIKYTKAGSDEVIMQDNINIEDFNKYLRYLKFQSRLDINTKSYQAGGCTITDNKGKCINTKISTYPYENSEILEIRTYTQVNDLKLKSWLQDPTQYEKMYSTLEHAKPGLLVISGPSGSGKTVMADKLMTGIAREKKIVTVENPIEILNDKLLQMQINEDMNITIDVGIRAALRQDPDYLFVSKIDGPKTVEAIKNAINQGKVVIAQVSSENLAEAERMIAINGFTQDEIINISNQTINNNSKIEIQLSKDPYMEHANNLLEKIVQKIYDDNFELGSVLINVDFTGMIESLEIDGKINFDISEDDLIKGMINFIDETFIISDSNKNNLVTLLRDSISKDGVIDIFESNKDLKR